MVKFQRPPLNEKEKEQFAENFIDAAPRNSFSGRAKKPKNEKKGVLFLRVPQQLIEDLERIHELTGYKPTIFCFQVIMEAVKEKLKSLEREI